MIPVQVVIGPVQATDRVPNMLAPKYRDDTPKDSDQGDKIAEGQESHRNGHMGSSESPKYKLNGCFRSQVICLVQGRKKLIMIAQYKIR